MIVEGKQKLYLSKKRLEFGAYALVYVGTSNNMKSRGVPAIALKASNEAGGFYFMSLHTGKRIHSYIWSELPIDEDVICRVEELATKEKQPVHIDNHPIFEWTPGQPIENNTVNEEPVLEIDEGEEDNANIDPPQQQIDVIEEEHETDSTGNYITDAETSKSKSDDEDTFFEETVLNFNELENQLDMVIDDIN